MRCWLAIAMIAACGPLSPPPPPDLPPWHPRDLSDLRGHWAGADRDNWGYDLRIDGNTFSLAVDRGGRGGRGGRGPCTERGTIALGAHDDARALTPVQLTYAEDTCNPSFTGATVTAYLHDGSEDWLELAFPDAIVHLMNQDVEVLINVSS